jgi:predicted RecA/RadA family phage recombinase
MASSYQQEGSVITYSNAGSAIAAGDVVVMGHTIGIALSAIAATTGTGPVAIEGVFSGIPKVSAAVFAQGEKLIWDVSAGKFDDSAATPATGDVTGAAIAWVAGANLETTCTIKLTNGNNTVT